MTDEFIENIEITYKYKRRSINSSVLYDMYMVKKLTVLEIASELNCSKRTVQYLLQKAHIKKTPEIRAQTLTRRMLEKYGVKCTLQLKEVNEKRKQTCIEKYGTEWPIQNPEVYQKQLDNNFKKYGTPFTGKVKEFIEKREKTCLERYNTIFPTRTEKVKDKIYTTKKKNGTFNTSKPEKEILELLKIKFSDVIYQYKSDAYPFWCDFYIPELDLYIEYQGFWNHGGKPFTGTEEDLKQLSWWNENIITKPAYKKAIDIWTVRDPRKREYAKENNLNWLEFFNMDQFRTWYQKEILNNA